MGVLDGNDASLTKEIKPIKWWNRIFVKFTLTTTTLILLTGLILSFTHIHREARIILKAKEDRVIALANFLAAEASFTIGGSYDPDLRMESLADMQRSMMLGLLSSSLQISPEDILYIIFLGKDGEPILHSAGEFEGQELKGDISLKAAKADDPQAPLVQKYYHEKSGQKIFDVALPIKPIGQKLGAIRIGYSVTTLQASIRAMSRKAIGATAVFIGLAILISFYLSRNITRPILRLSRVAKEVSRGNLNATAHIKSHDEVKIFADTFNEMTSKLKEIRGMLKTRIEATDEELIAKSEELEKSYKDLQKTHRELSTVFELGKDIPSILDVDKVLSRIASLAQTVIGFRNFAAWLVDDIANRIQVKIASRNRGVPPAGIDLATNENDPFHFMIKSGYPANIPDIKEEGYLDWLEDTKSILAVPFKLRDKVVGLFEVESSKTGAFSEADQHLLDILTSQAAVAIENAKLLQKTEMLSVTDGLTGLWNHRYFQEKLESEILRTKRYITPLSLIMSDLDHFKRFNDTYGHPVGDKILKRAASILKLGLRETDIVARYGGEEFAIILPQTELENGVKVAEKLRMALRSYNLRLDDESLKEPTITMSFGVACSTDGRTTRIELIEQADSALYEAKQKGRDMVCAYSS